MGAMLVRPWSMCPRPKILGCCIPWTKCPLAILPLTEPSLPKFWFLNSFLNIIISGLLWVWLTLCRVRLGQFHRYPMGRRIAAMDSALCDPCVTQSRVGTHWSGAQFPRDALLKGCNIQELLVGDTSVGETSTLHLYMFCLLPFNFKHASIQKRN